MGLQNETGARTVRIVRRHRVYDATYWFMTSHGSSAYASIAGPGIERMLACVKCIRGKLMKNLSRAAAHLTTAPGMPQFASIQKPGKCTCRELVLLSILEYDIVILI